MDCTARPLGIMMVAFLRARAPFAFALLLSGLACVQTASDSGLPDAGDQTQPKMAGGGSPATSGTQMAQRQGHKWPHVVANQGAVLTSMTLVTIVTQNDPRAQYL